MSYRVIVAEDEPLLLNNLIYKIHSLTPEFEVVGSAQTGIQAYELLEKHEPDLLITDIRMPAMDGLELIRKVHDSHPEVDCVILSGYSDFSYAQTAIHYNVKEYLLKPVEDEKLSHTLTELKNKYLVREDEYSRIFNQELTVRQPCEIAALVREYINTHYREDINLKSLAASMNYSGSYITKLFCQQYDYSPQKYLIMIRMNKAQHLLRNNQGLNIRQIGEAVGYFEQCYFSRAFKKFSGVSPAEYRDKESVR